MARATSASERTANALTASARLRVVLRRVHAEDGRVRDDLGLELGDAVEDGETLRHVERGARERGDLVPGLSQLAHERLSELPSGAQDDPTERHTRATVPYPDVS